MVVRFPCKIWEMKKQLCGLQGLKNKNKKSQKSAIVGVDSGKWHLQKQKKRRHKRVKPSNVREGNEDVVVFLITCTTISFICETKTTGKTLFPSRKPSDKPTF